MMLMTSTASNDDVILGVGEVSALHGPLDIGGESLSVGEQALCGLLVQGVLWVRFLHHAKHNQLIIHYRQKTINYLKSRPERYHLNERRSF